MGETQVMLCALMLTPHTEALDHLGKAENKLNEALETANDHHLPSAFDKIKAAIQELGKALDAGADTTLIIASLMESVEDAAYQRIADAESVAGAENDTSFRPGRSSMRPWPQPRPAMIAEPSICSRRLSTRPSMPCSD